MQQLKNYKKTYHLYLSLQNQFVLLIFYNFFLLPHFSFMCQLLHNLFNNK